MRTPTWWRWAVSIALGACASCGGGYQRHEVDASILVEAGLEVGADVHADGPSLADGGGDVAASPDRAAEAPTPGDAFVTADAVDVPLAPLEAGVDAPADAPTAADAPPDAPAALDAPAEAPPPPDAAEPGFVPLFDGVSLAGWHGDPAHWRVEHGEIVGVTDGTIKQNSFLIREGSHANFVLRLQFKLRNSNSGVNFRSEDLGDYVMRGYQADIAESMYTGQLYEERGRTFLARIDPRVVYPHVNLAGWNDYEITADGPHIVLKVNGFTTVDYVEADASARKDGLIGVQVHVGSAMEVRYRDVRLKTLP